MDEQLIFRSLRRQTTPTEEASVQAWLRESTENERAYRELGEVLDAASRSERPVETVAPSPFKLVHALESSGSEEATGAGESSPRRRLRPNRWLGGGGIAAALLVLGFVLARLEGPVPTAGFDADEFVTGVAETATLTLRDGTVVRLAPQSRLRLIDGTRTRDVALRGRAYFAVARDPARPFRINTDAGRIEVLGTRFDLETENEDLRLVVVEGRVALSARGGRTEVPAGEMRRVVDGTALPAVKIPDALSELSWVGNFLAFQETPLREAAREIAQHYGVRIAITDTALASHTITTWFADQTLDQVMAIFCMVAEARCTTDGDVITVESKLAR